MGSVSVIPNSSRASRRMPAKGNSPRSSLPPTPLIFPAPSPRFFRIIKIRSCSRTKHKVANSRGSHDDQSVIFRATQRSKNVFGARTRSLFWRHRRAKSSIAQTRAMGVSDITPSPLKKDQYPISELNNEKQVDQQPAEPGKKSAQLDYLQIGDCFVAT